MATPKAARIWDITRMNSSSFFGSKSDKEPQEFIDQVQKVIDIMGANSIEISKLATYQL